MLKTKGKPNFTEGPIFLRMLVFVLPIILTGLLQLVYNMADNIVVGNFSGDPDALAAVGQTSSYNNLIINLFLGISSGTGVVVAQEFGGGRKDQVSRTIHTSMLLAVLSGVLLMIIGFVITKPVLSLIVKASLLDKSTLYMLIICCGLPATSVYNFGASILRSLGDSKRPLIILGLSGLVNVGFNLVFVIVFKMSIAGVALATIISQYISAIAVTVLLIKSPEDHVALDIKKMKINAGLLRRILYCGIPAAIQSAIFSFANMILTSAVSTFPNETITANTIASNIDGITYTCMSGFTTSAMTFAGQNYGAMKKKRLAKVFLYSSIQVLTVGILVAQLELIFAEPLAGLFIGSDAVNKDLIFSETLKVMKTILPLYCICGFMNVQAGFLRGLGASTGPMLSSVLNVLIIRITWIFAIFPMRPDDIAWLYVCFPLTWIFTVIVDSVLLVIHYKRIKKIKTDDDEAKSEKETITA